MFRRVLSMKVSIRRFLLNRGQATRPGLFVAVLLLSTAGLAAPLQRPVPPQPKNITGQVLDLRGQPIRDARVFIRNVETGVTRTHLSDERGVYRVRGLPPSVDYEVYAEFEGIESERRTMSQFLSRVDNVLHFELDVAIIPAEETAADDPGAVTMETFDRVQIQGSFEMPEGLPAPIPAALLLHGFGETRAVWNELRERLLLEGWAVMTLDLRGHGQSRMRNREELDAEEAWRTDSRQFPLDVEPALDWLKSQPRLDSNRIAVIGTDVGANLALIAAGRFPEVGTAVAIDPVLEEALAMAGTAREFTPRMAHLIVRERETGQEVREFITGASRITVSSVEGGTLRWLAAPNTIDEIVRWLTDTY